jgi:hypothetical protein
VKNSLQRWWPGFKLKAYTLSHSSSPFL